MSILKCVIMVIVLCVLESAADYNVVTDGCANVKTPFEGLRKRRHLTFPPGTNVVLTMSLVKAVLVHAPSGWNVAVEIDVLYPLPNQEMMNAFFRKKIHHRQKRELWKTIETAFGSYNMNGRSCIYRSICEANLHLAPRGKSLVHDILRTIFTAPLHEEDFRTEVNDSYEELLHNDICDRIHDCPISLIEIILALNKSP